MLDVKIPLLGVGSVPAGVRGPKRGRDGVGGGGQRTEVGKKYAATEIGAPKERRVVEDVVFDQPSGHRIVKYAVAGADRSFPFLKGIPSHAQARSKVLVVLACDVIAIGRIDSPNDDSVRGISCAEYQIAGCSKGGCVRRIIHRGVKGGQLVLGAISGPQQGIPDALGETKVGSQPKFILTVKLPQVLPDGGMQHREASSGCDGSSRGR